MLKKSKACLTMAMIMLAFTTGCVPNNFSFSKEFGKSGSGASEFLSPTDLEIDNKGNLVVADAGNTRFQILTSAGNVIATGGEFGMDRLQLQSISGIGIDKNTNEIWVCDQKASKIVKFDEQGNAQCRAIKKVKYPMDVAVDDGGDIYVLMARKSEIYKYDKDGAFIETIGGNGKAALLFPTSIQVYNKHIYVTDFGSKRIVKLDMEGNFVSEIKKKGEYEEMKGPSSMYIDEAGNMYVLDLGEVPVVILSSKGEFISQIGSFGNQEGGFLYPIGVIAKNEDDVYVLDNSRNTIINFRKKSS